jgi:trehalose-phosphatase
MCTAAIALDPTLFFHRLRSAADRLLMLDYDGTIAPFTPDRKRAVPYASIPELLESISSTCRTRVVLISGRSAREIPPLLGKMSWRPEIWGVHGLERLYSDDRLELGFTTEDSLRVIAEAGALLDREGLGELCESKTGAVAVHWRGLSPQHVEEVRTHCYRLLAPLACKGNLLLSEFDGGAELKVRCACKGNAVRTLLAESSPETQAAFLGDDLTDEDAFEALQGRGLSVLVRANQRPTKAQMWLRPPGELLQFLTDWVHACGGDV